MTLHIKGGDWIQAHTVKTQRKKTSKGQEERPWKKTAL
jgi:hypothetical protein